MLVLLYLLPLHPPPHLEETISKGYANPTFPFMLQTACYLLCIFCFCVHSTMEKMSMMMSDTWEQFVTYEQGADIS